MPTPALNKRQRIVIIIGFAAILLSLFFFLDSPELAAVNAAEQRTEADCITRSFRIKQVWLRNTIQYRTNFRTVSLETDTPNIYLCFGIGKQYVADNEVYHSFASSFQPGDSITVKMYWPEYEHALSRHAFSKLHDWLTSNAGEVEMYQLIQNGRTVYTQPITNTSINFRSRPLLNATNVKLAVFLLIIVAGVIGAIRRKMASKKTQALN